MSNAHVRHRRAVRAFGVLATGALALTLAGCGLGAAGTTGAATTWTCAGPVSASVADTSITPIADNPKSSLPVTYTDYSGDKKTIKDTSRILALDTYGTLGTTVYALGLGDRMVGRDISTGLPELSKLPVVTYNGHELNAEAILELNPSVILTDYSIGPLEVQQQLADAGIPVVIMDSERKRSVVVPQIEAVAEVLGVPAEGKKLGARVAAEIKAAEADVAKLAPSDPTERPRIAFLYMRGTAGVYYWFGKGSGADDLIDALDGVDVASETGLEGPQPLTAEGLIKVDPSLYLMMSNGLESVGGIDGLSKVPGVADTTAGRSKCVVDMSDYELLSFGPQFPSTLRGLADAVYGQSR